MAKKMIKVSISFWTDQIPKSVGKKAAWAWGTIYLNRNEAKGIKKDKIFFNDSPELLPKLQKLLDRNGITLLYWADGEKVKKYKFA